MVAAIVAAAVTAAATGAGGEGGGALPDGRVSWESGSWGFGFRRGRGFGLGFCGCHVRLLEYLVGPSHPPRVFCCFGLCVCQCCKKKKCWRRPSCAVPRA